MEAMRGPRGWIVEVRRVVSEEPYRGEVVEVYWARLWEHADRAHSRIVEELTVNGYTCTPLGWAGRHRCTRDGETLDVELRPDWG